MGAFKLEKAIQTWLKSFQKHQAFDEGNLQEVEVHLRDHIDDLIGDGLSEEEAFEKAVESFGDQREVAKEEYWNQQRPPSIKRILFAAMVRNYYRTSVRTLLRNPLSSFINVFGLAVAIGACMVVYSAFQFDGSIDQFHANKNEVFLSTHYVDRGGKLEQYGTAPLPLGPSMLQDLAGISVMSRIADQSAVVKVGTEVYHESIRMVDPQFLDMFTFPMEKGAKSTLFDPSNVILSSSMAEKYFGDRDPIGMDLEVIYPNQEKRIYQVTGVAKVFPDARTIEFDFLVNFENISSARPGLRADDWSELITATFIQVEDPLRIGQIKDQMDQYISAQSASETDWPIQAFDFIPLASLHYDTSFIKDDISFDANAEQRLGLPIMAGFMIILACINYINISLNSAVKRLKEIGLRKVVGASRSQLIFQFLSENIVLTLFAFAVGMLLAKLIFLPWFINLSGDPMILSLLDPYLWLFGLVIVLITGVVSGLYPAIYISRFQSVEIFDGKLRFGRKSLLTKLFLGLQLVITCGSIACAIIFTQNNDFQHHQDWGYDKEQILFAKAPNAAGAAQLRDALKGQAGIEEVVRAQNHIGENHSKVIMQFPDREYEVDRLNVGADYLQAMGVPLSMGAFFNNDATGETSTAIVNQTLVKTLDLREPLGKVFDIDNQRYTITGVVSDFHNYSFFQEITPMLFVVADDTQLQYVAIRTDQQDQQKVYAQLQEHWYQLFPQTPFQGSYQEDVWGNYFSLLYSAERFYTALAFIAILLASLGLYGLITLNVTGRKLEFCIRKALGADMIHLLKSVSRQYMVLCLVSLFIGLPVSYWMADAALNMLYAYPMPLTISGFVYAMLAVVFILIAVIVSQVTSVLVANPATGLRTE